jgi:two-component system, OmpR family, response regulator
MTVGEREPGQAQIFRMECMEKLVFIIDNDCDLCRILSFYIKKKGFQTICVNLLRDVEEQLRNCQPHLILLDNKMDDGFGVDMITNIKALCPDTPVVLMTADDTSDFEKSDNFKIIDRILAKPFAPLALDQILLNLAA